MRADGELSFCRLMKGVDINNKVGNFIKNEVKKNFDIFESCYVVGSKDEDDE